MASTDISVVIPVYNEEKNVELLYKELTTVLLSLPKTFEIIFVDDGSKDNTRSIVRNISNHDPSVKIIELRKNFGKSIALNTAFRNLNGNIIITMDGDLQDDPHDIPNFLQELSMGFDMVVGWKFFRDDPVTKTFPSKIFNILTRMATGVELHDFDCGFKSFTREVTDTIYLYGEMHRYIPVLVAGNGFSISEIKIHHRPRKWGHSKYGFSRLIKGFLDLITVKFLVSYSSRPLHVFGLTGLISFASGVIIGIYLLFLKYFENMPIMERPLLLLSILLVILGFQFLSIGLLGEMITIQKIPTENTEKYVKKKIGFTGSD